MSKDPIHSSGLRKADDFSEIQQGQDNFLPSETPKKVKDAIRKRDNARKRQGQRTLEDVVAEAINPRAGLR